MVHESATAAKNGTGPPSPGDTNQAVSIGGTTQTTTARTVNDATYSTGNHVTSVAAAFNGLAQGDIGIKAVRQGFGHADLRTWAKTPDV